jgi:hypothetical protein
LLILYYWYIPVNEGDRGLLFIVLFSLLKTIKLECGGIVLLDLNKSDNREKFDEVGKKIWQLHLDLVKLKTQIDDQITTLDENHMHLGFNNKVAGNLGTGLNNRESGKKPVELSQKELLNNELHKGQVMYSDKIKNKV